MHAFEIIAILVSLTVTFSLIIHKYIGLHPMVGIMLIVVVFSLALVISGQRGFMGARWSFGKLMAGGWHLDSATPSFLNDRSFG